MLNTLLIFITLIAFGVVHSLLASHPACDEARAMLRDHGALPAAAPEDPSQAQITP